jgi:hypothetical protein
MGNVVTLYWDTFWSTSKQFNYQLAGAFTTRILNVRGDPLGTNFKEVRSKKRKISIQIC